MTSNRAHLPIGLLAVFLLLPAVRTGLAVHLELWPAVLYPLFQLAMIAIPVAVWATSHLSARQVRELAGLKRTNCLPGVLVGLAMAGTILAGYYTMFRSAIDPAPVLAKVESLGLLEWYWVMALVMSLWNSLYEEYYWRAFLVAELGRRVKGTLAVCVIGGAMFGLHHLFVLSSLFDWPLAALFTLGTMAAGAVWTLMRRRGLSIWDCYVSHVIADLSVFWLGWDLISRAS